MKIVYKCRRLKKAEEILELYRTGYDYQAYYIVDTKDVSTLRVPTYKDLIKIAMDKQKAAELKIRTAFAKEAVKNFDKEHSLLTEEKI